MKVHFRSHEGGTDDRGVDREIEMGIPPRVGERVVLRGDSFIVTEVVWYPLDAPFVWVELKSSP